MAWEWERNMIPLPDGGMGIGSFRKEELSRTLQIIKSAGRSVRVQAIAQDDTRVADVLRVDLHIR